VKRVSPYLKMRVLGAIEFAPGPSIAERIKHVSTIAFTDDNDLRFQFTWRTIQTWYSRYKKDGVTSVHPRTRSDKGLPRKVQPEQLAEAIDQVRAQFHGTPRNLTAVYRACVERGLLQPDRVARTTFHRVVKQYELLKSDAETTDKRRLAFAKSHANEMWQADTMFGPYVGHADGRPRPSSSPSSTTPAASAATASSSSPRTPTPSSPLCAPPSTSAASPSLSTSILFRGTGRADAGCREGDCSCEAVPAVVRREMLRSRRV
jgi:hypothetical protein